VGYPRFPAPVEFIAAVIAYYVHPVNIQTACLIMEGAEFTENIINGLLRRITRTENILHRNFTRRQVAIQNRVASNIGISQSTFTVKVLNLFSRSRRKTNKRKSKHSAMLRNKETRHRMFIGLLNT